MRRWIAQTCTLICIAAAPLCADSDLVDQAIEEAIAQHDEQAFTLFLQALEEPVTGGAVPEEKELALYEEALARYLNPEGKRSAEVADEILSTYQPIVANRPEYTLLNLLVATAYANKQDYETFFWELHRSYEQHPNHYLIDRTKAILNLRLMERARGVVERENYRKKVIEHLTNATKKYPADLTLTRMILSLGTPEEKEGVVRETLSRIVSKNIRLPRSDIFPYVKDAAAIHEFDLAQQLIDRALEWYRYSRSINSAQKYLDQKRKQHG